MNTDAIIVSIKTSDKLLLALQSQIEKYFLMQIWVSQAKAWLESYERLLNELDNERDPDARGRKIHDLESHFFASVSYYLRCYQDQPSTHLTVSQVTKEADLLKCHSELLTLRNDEFVHWKGIRSHIEVKYSFLPINSTEVYFAGQQHVSFNFSIGPKQEINTIIRLFQASIDFMENQKQKVLAKLRSHISTSDTLANGTQLINEQGQSLILNTLTKE